MIVALRANITVLRVVLAAFKAIKAAFRTDIAALRTSIMSLSKVKVGLGERTSGVFRSGGRQGFKISYLGVISIPQHLYPKDLSFFLRMGGKISYRIYYAPIGAYINATI